MSQAQIWIRIRAKKFGSSGSGSATFVLKKINAWWKTMISTYALSNKEKTIINFMPLKAYREGLKVGRPIIILEDFFLYKVFEKFPDYLVVRPP